MWGASYIDAFTRLALPSLLAPGNLPTLAEAGQLEVCVLTSKRDVVLFESKPAFQVLRALCPVRFIGIDDLLGSSVYGITLTLAYMRGIAAEGEEMVNVYFVFFNSDFILSQGSMRSVLAHIQAGHHAIMAPSFRAVAEDIEPLLEARVEGTRHLLAVPSRELVALALRNMHATIVAKTVNQTMFRSLFQNQLYWRVDRDTVLGRFYLMFMLCIRPGKVVRTADSYCDYGFAPALSPSLDPILLADSDDFFMLETQARQHESSHICLGPHQISDIAGYLSEWTTREHRLYAKQNLIFHAADVPPALDAFLADAEKAVDELERLLPPPRPHAFHPYWVGSLPRWRKEIEQRGGDSSPPELEAIAEVPVKRTLTGRIYGLARHIVRGNEDELKVWHAGWLDQRFVERVLHDAKLEDRRLIAADDPPIAARRSTPGGAIERMTVREALDAAEEKENYRSYDDVLVFLRSEHILGVSPRFSSSLLPLLKPGARLRLIVHDRGGEFMPARLAAPLLAMLAAALDANQVEASVEFVDGVLQRRIRLGVRRLGQLYLRLGWAWAPVLALGGLALLSANVLNHALCVLRSNSVEQPEYCGTMLVSIRRA